MDRRRFLQLLGTGGVLGAAGCLETAEPAGQAPESQSTPTATEFASVREWAKATEPKGPVRAEGAPVSVEQTITDSPGYEQDDMEYFPQNRTVRYVKFSSGGEPAAYGSWSFEEWGRIRSVEVGKSQAQTVTASRLGVEDIGSAVSAPPAGAAVDGMVITVMVSKTLDRDGDVVSWPVATFPALTEAAPRSVDVTLSIEGDTFSRTVPVYAQYVVGGYA